MSTSIHHPASGRNDLVPSQALQPLTVGMPMPRNSWHATVVVEVYALGRGVAIKGQEGDFAGRKGTLELKAPGGRLVFDPLAAVRTERLVLLVQGNVTTVFQPLQAEDKQCGAELAFFERWHGGRTLKKTAILSLPPGMGKTTVAHRLAKWLGCMGVVDEWAPGRPMFAGGLHLTNVPLGGSAA